MVGRGGNPRNGCGRAGAGGSPPGGGGNFCGSGGWAGPRRGTPLGGGGLWAAPVPRGARRGSAGGALRRHYRLFARDHSAEFKAILDRLIEPDRRPAVIHCTSGKDRTGFAIALVLLSLGVSEETALEDYALTNHYRRDIADVVGSGVDAAGMQILTSANPIYLKEGLDSARELYGSTEAYLTEGLALTEERLERFRRDMFEEDTP